jgi:hypothetical protein
MPGIITPSFPCAGAISPGESGAVLLTDAGDADLAAADAGGGVVLTGAILPLLRAPLLLVLSTPARRTPLVFFCDLAMISSELIWKPPIFSYRAGFCNYTCSPS